MLWCEVEDQGAALSVRIGPLNVAFCGMGHVIIPFDTIKAYRPARSSCEKKCGYGVAYVNGCTSGGLRQHALCGVCCKQRPIVIEYKDAQTLCGKTYRTIMIALEQEDYQPFMQMMDRKFGVVSRASVVI